MAIPSGSGTEVLKRVTLNSTSSTAASLIAGVANHIYTIISIIVSEGSGSASEIIEAYVEPSGGTAVNIFRNQAMPAYGSFVWNDKFVITGTDNLIFKTATAADIDVICSYIDQDWS
tara:strand:+ start:1704 stop:2054 length:351 start_codon:yes stop_codon:yes gene_type:complete